MNRLGKLAPADQTAFHSAIKSAQKCSAKILLEHYSRKKALVH